MRASDTGDPKRAGRIKAPSIKTFWFHLSLYLLLAAIGVETVKYREGGDAALGKMFKWEFHRGGSLTERLSKLYYFSALIPAGKIHTFHFLNVCHPREITEYPELQKNCVICTYMHTNTLKHTKSINQQTQCFIHCEIILCQINELLLCKVSFTHHEQHISIVFVRIMSKGT